MFFAFATLSFSQLRFGAGVSTEFDFLAVQGKVFMDLEEKTGKPLDGAGTFSYFFVDAGNLFVIDLDAHYRLLTLGDDIAFAPLAGLNIARASIDLGGLGNASNTDIGINLGGNFTIPLGGFMIYAQPKIVLGGLDDFVISAGILF